MPAFLGRSFRGLDPRGRLSLGERLRRHPQPLSGYTLAMLVAWDPVFRYAWTPVEPDAALISCRVEPDPNPQLLQPVGALAPEAQRALVAQAARLPYALKLYGVGERFLAEHEELAAAFNVVEERSASNYVYAAEDLALLAGRRFAAKRNHLAQASREYRWLAAPLTPADVPEALALAEALFAESDQSPSLARDVLACGVALRELEALGLRGTAIRVEGRLVAFSIWEAMGPETAVVHFERAQRTLKGLYQVVNHEAAKTMHAEGFRFINREEDLGDEGLRKAKLSYNPVRLEPSFTLTFRA